MRTAIDLNALSKRIAAEDPIAYKELFLLYQPRLIIFSCSIFETKTIPKLLEALQCTVDFQFTVQQNNITIYK